MQFKDVAARVLQSAEFYVAHGRDNLPMRTRQEDLQLIASGFKSTLRIEFERTDLEVKVGGQQGSYSPVPWIRVFNRKTSPSAHKGYYLVYLFAADGSAVYASLNLGTSELRESSYKPSRDIEGITSKSLHARKFLEAQGAEIIKRGLVKIDLRAESQIVGGESRRRIHNYELANIIALRYDRSTLPEGADLTRDLLSLVSALDLLDGINISVDRPHYQEAPSTGIDLSVRPPKDTALSFTSASMQTDTDFDDRLEVLVKFGFGGANVAKEPNDDVEVPVRGTLPLGAQESIQWFEKVISSSTETQPALILVGAPGNGKSFVAQEVRKLFDSDASPSNRRGIHRRIYNYSKRLGDRVVDLTVVNDATIDSSNGQLIEDFDQAISRGASFLANVNRGVLYEELTSSKRSMGSEVIRWVADEVSDFEPAEGFSIQEETGDSGDAIRSLRIRDVNSNREVHVTALYLDSCSLFEVQPTINNAGAAPVLQGNYHISALEVRKRDLSFTARTPAGDFGMKTVSWLSEVMPRSAGSLDPFVANVQTIASPQVLANVLTVVRCAEIASGSRISYRELWGLFVTLICGNFPSQGGRSSPREWLESHLNRRPNPARSNSLEEAADWLMTLGDRRMHQALFGVNHQGRSTGVNPGQIKMILVDPVNDTLLASIPSVSPVHEAFYGNDRGDSILDILLSNTDSQSPLFEFVTEFDRAIDRLVSEILGSDNDARGQNPQRNRLLRWYGAYLTRLYSLAHGMCGFESQIRSWIECWTFAQSDDGQIPVEVESGLKTLFLPLLRGGPDEERLYSYLPPFDALTEPLRFVPVTPRLAVRLVRDNIRFRPEISGERLMVRVTNAMGRNIERHLELELDFNLLREVLASSSGDLGITESSDRTSPRIERFRSGLVSWGSNNGHVTVVRPDDAVWACQVRDESLS